MPVGKLCDEGAPDALTLVGEGLGSIFSATLGASLMMVFGVSATLGVGAASLTDGDGVFKLPKLLLLATVLGLSDGTVGGGASMTVRELLGFSVVLVVVGFGGGASTTVPLRLEDEV